MAQESMNTAEGHFFPISPLLLFPETSGEFGVYIKINDRFLLYAHPNEPFSEAQRQKLYENGVDQLWVVMREKESFESYLERHLGSILDNESLPLEKRAQVFYDVSLTIFQETFKTRLPGSISPRHFERIQKLVTQATRFLARGGSLKSLTSLISHDYRTYSHSVHVFVYTTAILQTYDLEESDITGAGIGAILHDIGKVAIPREIINKPGALTSQERRIINTHPVKGVALCSRLPLSQSALHVILFHHEKKDGSGYPAGMKGPDIPLPVKAATLADVYDAITTVRPYAPALTPFQALTTMRDQMPGHFDREVFKRLIQILSGAALI